MSRELSAKFRVICFIPMKNCEPTIRKTLECFQGEILDYIKEIVVVDNASNDKSVQEAKEGLAKISQIKVTLLQNSRNYGLGGSHKIAFKYALDNEYDYILVVHGDGSADVRHFLPVMKNYDFIRYDMVLSTRLSTQRRQVNYPAHRFWVNRLLSLFASLLTWKPIKDFSGGPINLYRMPTFLSKFENSIKQFSNDVAFAQYMLIYGIYRRAEFYFHAIDHHEQDAKPFNKLVPQFGKSVLLLLKFLTRPKKTIKHDVFGTFFGHHYRVVKVENSYQEETPIIHLVAPPEIKIEPEVSKVSILPTTPLKPPLPVIPSFELNDLKSLGFADPYLKSFETVNFNSIESCDINDESNLWIQLKLGPELLLSKGLKSYFLRLLKVYSDNKIFLDISADKVLSTKQCFEFLSFCKNFRIDTHVVSNLTDSGLWKLYQNIFNQVTLNYEYGLTDRNAFYKAASVFKPEKLNINVISHQEKFYHCLGLMKKIEEDKLSRSVFLQPYAGGSVMSEDHVEIISKQKSVELYTEKNSLTREHYLFPNNGNFVTSKVLGFNRLTQQGQNHQLKTIKINEQGEISLNDQLLGSLYDETMPLLNKMAEATGVNYVPQS